MSVSPDIPLAAAGVPRLRRGTSSWRRLATLPVADRLALGALVLVLVVSLLGPVLAPREAIGPAGAPFTAPSGAFPLGTDDLGQDLLSRVLSGAQKSWIGAFVVIAFGVCFGGAVGLVAGAAGGWVDAVLMRITDAFLALPAPVLALSVAAALGRSWTHTLMAVAVVWWPLYARVVRGQVRASRSMPFVDAARLAGCSRSRLLLRHLLPGALPPIVIAASLDVGGLILTVSGLSFLGLGSPQPAPELGAMVASGLPYLLSTSWVALVPALAIFVIALVSNLGGDALRDLLDA